MVDDRKLRVLETELYRDAVMSMAFSPSGEHLGVGSESMYIYRAETLGQGFRACFRHMGLKGIINDFNWNREDSRSLLATCQESEPEGGLIHMFRPLSLLMMPQDRAEALVQAHLQS